MLSSVGLATYPLRSRAPATSLLRDVPRDSTGWGVPDARSRSNLLVRIERASPSPNGGMVSLGVVDDVSFEAACKLAADVRRGLDVEVAGSFVVASAKTQRMRLRHGRTAHRYCCNDARQCGPLKSHVRPRPGFRLALPHQWPGNELRRQVRNNQASSTLRAAEDRYEANARRTSFSRTWSAPSRAPVARTLPITFALRTRRRARLPRGPACVCHQRPGPAGISSAGSHRARRAMRAFLTASRTPGPAAELRWIVNQSRLPGLVRSGSLKPGARMTAVS